ncbi:MAG: UDP-N-acetylmuramoyl-L-alanine--D-glutamate ligase [Candidatus Caenarcaniphilales bacterium]|jgi:UDP-N-acetylmuramoylalanine--D-glutamate ligase|nr:UDP-N-acetylmuramoyl-L-alanine--D-glutamate ligase [Candidatus Caenarcaniphilales bacterium]
MLESITNITLLGFAKSTIATAKFLLINYPQIKIKFSEAKAKENFDLKTIEDFEEQKVIFEFSQQTLDFIISNAQTLVITSPGIPPQNPIIIGLKEQNIKIITDYDLFCEQILKHQQDYIAITGTNGKTTTTSIVAHILEREALGNIGKPFMEMSLEEKIIQSIEISSFQLFHSELSSIKNNPPKASIYLNLTEDHLDWHKDMQEYREAKEKLFQSSTTKENFWILNYDDAEVRNFGLEQNLNNKTKILWFSVEDNNKNLSGYLEKNILYIDSKPLIDINDLLIVGKHNYSNVLAASLALKASGISLEDIQTKLRSFKAPEHRLEFVKEINGHKIYNDSKATNPDSSIKAIDSFESSIVILGGKNKNLDLNEFLNYVSKKCHAVVCIGELQDSIYEHLVNIGYKNISKAKDLNEALELSIAYGKDNTLPIVLSPASSSFDMFKNYEDRGKQFKSLVDTRI